MNSHENNANKSGKNYAHWLERLQALTEHSELVAEHLSLHAGLWQLEWEAEKRRLIGMAFYALVGLMLCASMLLFVSVFLLAISWSSGYCIPVFAAICAGYFGLFIVAWFQFVKHASRGSNSFLAARQQLAEDVELCKVFFS